MAPPDPMLETRLAALTLRSPVILAAGTAGTLDEVGEVLDLSRVGALVTKSITAEPRAGNPPWRVAPLRAGMLNAIGLANPGIDAFMRDHAPRIAGVPTTVLGSIAGFCIDDYVAVARRFSEIDAMPGVELNVSCPNVHGGVEFGVDPDALGELIKRVRAALGTHQPAGKPTDSALIVKLSPIAVGRPSMVDIARAAIEAGADALTISNTVPAMGIEVETRRPMLGNRTGGLSGPAVHPIALKLVHDVHKAIARDAGVPIIGLGGVLRWQEAAAFILAGASAVAIGTGLFVNPRIPRKVNAGLAKWARRQGAQSVRDLVGTLHS
ncbi:MAG: dihydroorotate dehydrogenase [Phycisphaerales bacterium JB037]